MGSRVATHCKITIRQPVALKRKIEQAAAKQGMTVTSFIKSTLERVADRTLQPVRRRELSEQDQKALLALLTNPQHLNKSLIRAAERYRKRYGGDYFGESVR